MPVLRYCGCRVVFCVLYHPKNVSGVILKSQIGKVREMLVFTNCVVFDSPSLHQF